MQTLWDKFLALQHHMLEAMAKLTIPPEEDAFLKCRAEWNYYKRIVTEAAIKEGYEPGAASDCLYRMFLDPRWTHYRKVRNYRWVRTPEGKAHTKASNAAYYIATTKKKREDPAVKAELAKRQKAYRKRMKGKADDTS